MPKLTKRTVDNLPAQATGQTLHWDDELKGFGVRTTAKAKAFILDRKFNGKSVRLTIGRYPAWSVDLARKEASRLTVEMDKGIDPRQVASKAASDGIKLGLAFERFLNERELKPRTRYDYLRYMTNEPKPGTAGFFQDWQGKPITEITGDMIAARYAQLKSGPRGTAQASSAMRVLRSVLNFAIESYDLDCTNPVATLTSRRSWVKANRRRGHLHTHEIRPFVRALRAVPNRVLAAYLEFILFTGARRSEAARLKWKDVNRQSGVLTFTETKQDNEPRTVPITKRIGELLDAMTAIKAGEYVFPSIDKNGKPAHVTEPRKALARANKAAGTEVTVHDLRRTYATTLESMDCPMTPLKALLGHSLGRDVTNGHYIVIAPERLRPWCDKYDAHMQRVVATDPEDVVVTLRSAGAA
ncbi:MAG: integrase family protein [Herminiimonas sp.]|nr:integrase family protein [Herminiimonas sp.]